MLDARKYFVLRGTTNLKRFGILNKIVSTMNAINCIDTTSEVDNQKGQYKLTSGMSIDVQEAKRVGAYP